MREGIPGLICREELSSIEGLNLEFKTVKGRFREEENIEVYSVRGDVRKRLFVLKVFHGRPPFYRRWVEVFYVKPGFTIDGVYVEFANSLLERRLVECLSRFLQGGEWLYIEYMYDGETRTVLELGFHPVLTRLGYLLFQNGFTWFKDWYYPEGFMEGEPKLQAEKPLTDEIRRKHLEILCREVQESLGKLSTQTYTEERSQLVSSILERANRVLNECSRILAT